MSKQLELLINADAYMHFLYMRDYKPDEVTMFGITHPNNPLHVYKFALVKQKVNSVSSDCDPEYMADFLVENISKGIMPINCERVWCHTHPMTGENSANPSGKDMATWNDPDNAQKNFMVMMILSRSGQITCKLKIRTNLSNEIAGWDHPYEIEKEIPVKIVQTEENDAAIKAAMVNKYGEQAVNALGNNAYKVFSPYMSIKDIYPDSIAELELQYEQLVSKDMPTYTHVNARTHGHFIGSNNVNFFRKKNASTKNVPEILLRISEHARNIDSATPNDFSIIKNAFNDLETKEQVEALVNKYHKEHDEDANTSIVAVLLGAIEGDLFEVVNNKNQAIIQYKGSNFFNRCKALNASTLLFQDFKTLASKFNTGDL